MAAGAGGAVQTARLRDPCAIAALVWWSAPRGLPLPVQVSLTLAAVAALGPLLYRIAYRPLAEASVLVLLVVSVAVHFALTGLGLWFFGAEGSRTPAFVSASFQLGDVSINAQSLLVVATSAALIGVLYLFFERTLLGKALHATAVNRVGARLALGAVAPLPWRARTAERVLAGRPATAEWFGRAADAELAAAAPLPDNAFKVTLARNVIVRMLCELAGTARAGAGS